MHSLHIRRPWPLLATALAIAFAISATACSSSTTSGTSTIISQTGGTPELGTITVGVLSALDDVTVQIAQDEGFFKQVGLNVKVVPLPSTSVANNDLGSRTLDFTTENYVDMFVQQYQNPGLNLRIVADNTQAAPGQYVLMVPKSSKIVSLYQLQGRKVALPEPSFNFGSLSADILMEPYHLSSSSFTTVPLSFSDSQRALDRGSVDAAFTTEPFITTSEEDSGDRVIQDMFSGPLIGFPVSCWGTTASFVQRYPKTVAAFQRAMVMAARMAASNTALVRQELPRFIPTMTQDIANVITLPNFNTTLTLSRMQRVADTMELLHALPARFDVASMDDQPPAGS